MPSKFVLVVSSAPPSSRIDFGRIFQQEIVIDASPTIDHARRLVLLMRPYEAIIVDARPDLKAAVEFCTWARKTAPQAKIAYIAERVEDVPKDDCADAVVLPARNEKQLVEKIRRLLA